MKTTLVRYSQVEYCGALILVEGIFHVLDLIFNSFLCRFTGRHLSITYSDEQKTLSYSDEQKN